MQIGAGVYHSLEKVTKAKYGQVATNVGDEGGFAVPVQDNNEALDVLMAAIIDAGHEDNVKLGTDVPASELYLTGDGKYDLDFKNPNKDSSQQKSAEEMIEYYKNWFNSYPSVSIEDPFDQDGWSAYSKFEAECGGHVQIVGDHLLVTNPKRVKEAIEEKACNALLSKVDQIGSVTEAIEASDVVAAQIKTGGPCRSERLAKYNQLMRIEEELVAAAVYAGKNFRKAAQ
ncbi:enolase, putative [Perkinsus marinus ATCC 50983]|uniref:phosphopyruvate hydratase n=1 Tax=Perkinsus marinus (strain ATCC 50983 / TXsc) TaxID=423536 RepID=C5LTQ4_PERM5|nr:enolase, putative [Perkinsus marinus ATCC 50983]EEQ99866.1 enolase, putative [Perkinsus marinus ATCC 50983]|eukprot:XP_002767149.1 enolase, putative [Perkinsus marinus ATCC 50983]